MVTTDDVDWLVTHLQAVVAADLAHALGTRPPATSAMVARAVPAAGDMPGARLPEG